MADMEQAGGKEPDPQPQGKGLSAFVGNTIEERVAAAAEAAPVVVFGKEHCPFCIEVRRTFDQLGVPHTDHNVDTMEDGAEVWQALKTMHAPQTTVPYVYINKVMVGGCDATKKLQYEGKLAQMLATVGIEVAGGGSGATAAERIANCGVREGAKRAGGTLFHFPEAVDNRAARFNGFWSFVICLLCAIFYKTSAAHWVMGGLMCEYAVRLLGGGNFSALGSLTALCTAIMEMFGSKPTWVAGPPKQFATLCGLMFSTLAFFFFLVSVHDHRNRKVGLAFTCGLAAATMLEGVFNFCVGCWMFGMMIKFKLAPADAYTTYTNAQAEIEYTWEELAKRLNEGPPEVLVHKFSEEHPTQVDYKTKNKTDDMTKEDFHPVKHVKITHFVMHLGVVGLATAWKSANPIQTGLDVPAAVWYSIAIFSAIWFGIWAVLYVAKMAMYPRKVLKEYHHNISGNLFTVPFIILMLFSYMEADRDLVFAKVLFWIGAPINLLVSIIKVGDWIASKKDLEHINAAWMMIPVGNFVAAAAGCNLDGGYRDAMHLWFAVAFVMWLVLFVITFYRAVVLPEYDDRARPMLAAWVAAPAIGAVAYIQCFLPSVSASIALVGRTGSGFNDFIFLNMYWLSIALALVLGWCFVRPYMGRIRFDMSYWAGGFPSAALAMVSIMYHYLKRGELSQAIAYTCLAITSWMHVALLLQTAAALVRGRVFVPDYKWGPMSFMRLSHEAVRGVIARLRAQAKSAGNDKASAAGFTATWQGLQLMFEQHSVHEDSVIFPEYEALFPGVTSTADSQHKALHDTLERLSGIVAGGDLACVDEAAEEFAKAAEEHLRHEEDYLQGIPRKYIPLAQAKEIVRKCWLATPITVWHQLLPLMVNSLPMLHQRTRFLKTLLWSMPEHGQAVGLILSLGVDAVQWRRITDEMPELIPRGAAGWERYY